LSIIVGTHTPPNSGAISFTRIGLNSGTHILTSAAAGTTAITFSRCVFNLTNGYVFNLTNWTGALKLRYCIDNSTINGVVSNAAGSAVTINHSLVGKGTANVFTANGNVFSYGTDLSCPIALSGTGVSQIQGGSLVRGNVSTADTHTLTIGIAGISSGAASAITHNSASTMVLNNVVVNSSNATAIAGTGSIQTMSVSFPTSNVIAGTITTLLTGVTRTAEMWADNITRMKDTGFYSWAAGAPYFDDATLGTFKLLVGGTGYIKGKRVTWVAQNYTGMVAGNTYFIYIDSTGTIGAATAHTGALYEDYILLFQCLRDSTPVTNNQVTVKENHPYSFQPGPSNWMHDVAGILIQNVQNGANIALDGTQGIQINGADVLTDHGLDTTIPDSGGAAVTWIRMYTNAGGKWARQNATTTFTGYWNNAGTATALSANRWAVYTLYCSKDTLNTTTPTYFAVLDVAQYTTQANANTAIANGTVAKATNELAALELAQLGYITYRQSTAAITNVVISKSTLRATFSTGGTNTASLVNTNVTNFNAWLSAADSNVQAALDTLDDVGLNVAPQYSVLTAGASYAIHPLASVGTTGQVLVAATGNYPAFGTALVNGGGTGIATTTAYAPICGGTTATGAFQAASTGLASSGYVLTSNGASAVPSFQVLPTTVTTINGNSGSVTGATITITTGSTGGTALFSGSGTTLTLVETDASINTGWGLNTLYSLTSGTHNSAFGKDALTQLTSGKFNCSFGTSSNFGRSTGDDNCGFGFTALYVDGSGSKNTAFGSAALAILNGGTRNVGVGYYAGYAYASNESNNICIGDSVVGVVGESTTTRIGLQGTQTACYIAGISGVSTSNSNYVTIDTTTGHLGSVAIPGITWVDAAGATQAMAISVGYVTNRGGGVVYTLPATAALGDIMKVVGKAGLATITPNANQQILMGSGSGAVGITGTAVATNAGDCMELICVTAGASTVWRAASWIGNWTLTV
jgi:hypothetical protein